jgi:FMNH2-dependent dimethyl sulfone monooxygenase
MQFGIYAPVPHVTVGSKAILRSIAGAMAPLPDGTVDPAFDLAKEVLLEADRAGFDIILFAERHLGADLEAWVLACAISSWTQRIRSMVAVHPGLWHPELIAKMAASLDRITKGRMAINLVTGWNVEEHRMFGGDALVGDDDRYIRAEEFIEVVRGMWRETPFSHQGAYYPADAAELRLKPATAQPPEIFTASRSERGLDMVAKIADWWFVDFDKTATTPDEYMDGVQRSIEGMRRRVERYGRNVRFALNPFIAFGESDEAAVARTRDLLAPEPGDGDVRKVMQRIAPAMLAGCIGRPEKVRARLQAFAAAGVELFLFKFVPTVEDVRAIRDEIIIPLRAPTGAAQLVEA